MLDIVLDTVLYWTLDNVDPVKPQDMGGRWRHNLQDTETLIKTSLYRKTGNFTFSASPVIIPGKYEEKKILNCFPLKLLLRVTSYFLLETFLQ